MRLRGDVSLAGSQRAATCASATQMDTIEFDENGFWPGFVVHVPGRNCLR